VNNIYHSPFTEKSHKQYTQYSKKPKKRLGFLSIYINPIVGSTDVRDWQTAGALQRPPACRVVDGGKPSRVDKRVAPDREGAADKQCQGEGKL